MIGQEEIKAVNEVLTSGWLTTGPKVQEFEKNMQDYLGCVKAVGLTSCTGGLHIALAALGIGPGDEVIVPTYTFAASAHVVEWLGAKPVLVDVEKDTFNVDPKKIKQAITAKTKVIMPVHFAGHACEMEKIMSLAKEHNLYVIEDAAHAIGTEYKGTKIGNFGEATVFSFYVTKTITTAEGGMIVTNNAELGQKLKRYSYFGVDKDAFGRYSDKGNWYYEIIEPGFKYNMDNIQGALGVEQLKKLDEFIEKRRQLAALYNHLLQEIPEIKIFPEKEYTKHSYHLYPILIDSKALNISRAEFIDELKEYKIGTSVHFIPLHLHPYYQKKYGFNKGDFPVAEMLYENEISLPLYPGMNNEDIIYVVKAIKEIIQRKKKKKKIIALIQARIGSQRLPGKVMLPIGESTVLKLVYQQVSKAESVAQTIIATSNKENDHQIADFCQENNMPFFRGDEEDVLARFYGAASEHHPDYIIRICADQPFLDPAIIDFAVKEHLEKNVDYSTTVGMVPKGLDLEIFSFSLLKEAHLNSCLPEEKEHVTTYILHRPEKYKIQKIKFPDKISRPEIVLTLDTHQDYEFLSSVYNLLGEKVFNVHNIVDAYDQGIFPKRRVQEN